MSDSDHDIAAAMLANATARARPIMLIGALTSNPMLPAEPFGRRLATSSARRTRSLLIAGISPTFRIPMLSVMKASNASLAAARLVNPTMTATTARLPRNKQTIHPSATSKGIARYARCGASRIVVPKCGAPSAELLFVIFMKAKRASITKGCRSKSATTILFPNRTATTVESNDMLDDPVAKLWMLRARDAERKLLRAKTQYDVVAARLEHQQALDELERHKVADRG